MAAQIGITWKIGNGKNIRFWEDHWFGNSILCIQYWSLYIIIEHHGKTVAEVWDELLKLSFRRCVAKRLMVLCMSCRV